MITPAISASAANVERKPPSTLPHIPIEVLRQIAVHLDRRSAAALSRTCKALRDAGEIKVWEQLDLTSGYNPVDLETPGLDVDECTRRQDAVQSIVESRFAALRAHPFRVECVQTVRIEPSNGIGGSVAQPMFELIKLVAPTTRRFASLQVGWGDLPSHYHDQLGAVKLFEALGSLSFPRVVELQLSLHMSAGLYELEKLLPVMPNIEALELCASDMSYASVESRVDLELPTLSKLRRLVMVHLDEVEDDMTLTLLPKLIKSADGLTHVSLAGDWNPEQSDPTFRALRDLKDLESLEMVTGALDGVGMMGKQGFAMLDRMVVEEEDMDETAELELEGFPMPRLPKIKNLGVVTSPRLSSSEYASLGLGPTPDHVGHIFPSFVRRLNRNSTLTTLQIMFQDNPFPSTFSPASSAIRPDLLTHPSTWESKGARGVIIRTYKNPFTGEILYHFRALTRSLEHASGQSYVGAKRVWRDFSHFRGRTVPLDILRGAYLEAEMEMNWMEGGRDLEFGLRSVGWKVIEDWREEAGDESDMEYEESDVDSEEGWELSDEDNIDGETNLQEESDWEDTDEDVNGEDPIGGWEVD